MPFELDPIYADLSVRGDLAAGLFAEGVYLLFFNARPIARTSTAA